MRISDWSSDVCTSSDQITGRQPADEKHRFLPGAEAAEERDEHTLTGLGHAPIIGGHCLRFGHYPGSRSERRWSAMSLARPAPRSDERRVGKEWSSRVRFRWLPDTYKKKH